MLENIDYGIHTLNNNKYFYAIMMLMLNIGAKYIEMDLLKSHKQFLSSKIIRRFMIFTVAFIATKDIIASLIITASFVIIVLNLFNSQSRYCVLPSSVKELDINNDGQISPEEIKKAYLKLKSEGKID
tara:strand:- start:5594 stop:5977 length:384 start_codon:yes stop_codon:yes gene_type:complete